MRQATKNILIKEWTEYIHSVQCACANRAMAEGADAFHLSVQFIFSHYSNYCIYRVMTGLMASIVIISGWLCVCREYTNYIYIYILISFLCVSNMNKDQTFSFYFLTFSSRHVKKEVMWFPLSTDCTTHLTWRKHSSGRTTLELELQLQTPSAHSDCQLCICSLCLTHLSEPITSLNNKITSAFYITILGREK